MLQPLPVEALHPVGWAGWLLQLDGGQLHMRLALDPQHAFWAVEVKLQLVFGFGRAL